MEESAIDMAEASPKSRPRNDQEGGEPARREAAGGPLPFVAVDEPTRGSPRAEATMAPFESGATQELTCTSEASSSIGDSCQLAIDDANAKVEAMKFRDIQKELKVRLCNRVGVPERTVFCSITIAIKSFESTPCIMSPPLLLPVFARRAASLQRGRPRSFARDF